jgi:transposase-like protein
MEKRRNYKPEEKAKIVLEVLREEKTLTEIAAYYEVHPNQLSRWKVEFIQNAGRAFSKKLMKWKRSSSPMKRRRTSF